jgi:hypothetical protein
MNKDTSHYNHSSFRIPPFAHFLIIVEILVSYKYCLFEEDDWESLLVWRFVITSTCRRIGVRVSMITVLGAFEFGRGRGNRPN